MKKAVGNFLLQMIPVALGVYLGFLVSDWSENNSKRAQRDQLKASMLSEMQVNLQQLEKIVDYHRVLKDSSQYYANPSNPIRKPYFFRGTRMSKLSNSAYMTGIQTGAINELPLETIQKINQVYTRQNDYNDYGTLILSGLINKKFSEKKEDMRDIAQFLAITMVDVVAMEQELILKYQNLQIDLEK
ncbi:MAG: hypothetical protein AAF135_14300 [Bacteroidota bacterium]